VNLVQVDAIVTDGKEKPVLNLTADDFELLQDGKPQAITTFAFINVKDSKVNAAPLPSAPQTKNGPPPPSLPPMALRPDQIRRTIALVVDDLGLSADSTIRVRQSLKNWVDKEMQPGDLVAIIRTSAGMGSLQQFTNDKRILYGAIDLVQFHLGRVGVSSFAPLQAKLETPPDPRSADSGDSTPTTDLSGLGGVPPAGPIDTTIFDEEVAEAYTLGSIGAVQYVLTGLREMPGRKSMVLFSESMRFNYITDPGPVRTQETSHGLVEERLRKLVDAANRSSVVIYAIDPRGVVNTVLAADDTTTGRSPREIAEVSSQRTRELIASQDGMIALSQKTGGLFLANNDLQGSLRQVIDDGDGYYLLGYQPDTSTFAEKSRAPKFHSISVKVKRPGLRVRSRSGFFGTSDGMMPPATTRREQITRAFQSPFTTGSIHVQLTTLFSNAGKDNSYINALLHFDTRDLSFSTEPDGSHKAQVDTFAATFDVDGHAVDAADKTWSLTIPEKSFEGVLKSGLTYSFHVPVKKPGAYQMRMVLRDSSGEVGTARQFIEVPDVNKGRLALSGLVLSVEKPRTAPTATEPAEGALDSTDPNQSPAVRIFKTGTPIVYLYQIFNARMGSDKKPQLDVQTRLFKDGQALYATTPSPLPGQGDANTKTLTAAGRIQVSQAPPGQYVLQVIITDKLAKKLAAQSMDFEIRQ
jgi:VWFA-related protein